MRQVSESLAGRLSLIELAPLAVSELVTDAQRRRRWLHGGYPDGGVLRGRGFPVWQIDYLALLAQRDLPNRGLPAPPRTTERLLRLLAAVEIRLERRLVCGHAPPNACCACSPPSTARSGTPRSSAAARYPPRGDLSIERSPVREVLCTMNGESSVAPGLPLPRGFRFRGGSRFRGRDTRSAAPRRSRCKRGSGKARFRLRPVRRIQPCHFQLQCVC